MDQEKEIRAIQQELKKVKEEIRTLKFRNEKLKKIVMLRDELILEIQKENNEK